MIDETKSNDIIIMMEKKKRNGSWKVLDAMTPIVDQQNLIVAYSS